MLFPPTKPYIHFANWGQVKAKPPEDVYSIMGWTPKWVLSNQNVPILIPQQEDLSNYKNGLLSIEQYSARYITGLMKRLDQLTPISLYDSHNLLIPDGAYLCCSCSKEKASQNKCHRTWAAYILKEVGWLVTLDGYVI